MKKKFSNCKVSGSPCSRALHLIDIENICQSSNPTLEEVLKAREEYLSQVDVGELDQFLVTVSSSSNLEAALFGWPSASVKCKEGHDGADILLAEQMLQNQVRTGFSKVRLASGDGGLAPFVRSLVRLGVYVEVICRIESVSPKMRTAASTVTYLKEHGQLTSYQALV